MKKIFFCLQVQKICKTKEINTIMSLADITLDEYPISRRISDIVLKNFKQEDFDDDTIKSLIETSPDVVTKLIKGDCQKTVTFIFATKTL